MQLVFLPSKGATSWSAVFAVGSGTFLCYLYARYLWTKSKYKGLPSPPASGFLTGHLFDTLGSVAQWNTSVAYPEPFLTWIKKYGGAIYLREVFNHVVMLSDPKAIQHVLVTNHTNYQRDPVLQAYFTDITFGPGLMSLNGKDHERFRKILNPLFTTSNIKKFLGIFESHTNHYAESILADACTTGDELDMGEVLMTLTLEIIGVSIFGIDFNKRPDVHQTYHNYLMKFNTLLTVGTLTIPGFLSLPFPSFLRRRKIQKQMKQLMIEIIDHKLQRGQNDQAKDLLDLLLPHATTDEAITQTMSFSIAGHTTSAAGLGWVFAELSQSPNAVEKIRQEYKQVIALHGSLSSWEAVSALHYTSAVIQESMRLHAVASMITPLLTHHDDVLPMSDDTQVSLPKGSVVQIQLAANHLNPKYWANAKEFIPERFIEGTESWQVDAELRGTKSHAYYYMPFSAGGKSCIGQRFAFAEMQVITATLMSKYQFTLTKNADLRHSFEDGILSPSNLRMTLQSL